MRVTHADTQRMMTWLLANRKEPYFTVTVQSASAPFNYSFTPYITAGQSFWVDWGDGSEETFTTASTAEKSHEYSTPGTKTIRMLGSAGISRVRISPTNAGQAALVINSNGNLDKLGTITDTTDMFRGCPNLAMTELTGGITSIGDRAFNGCTNLALTSLPEGVTSIGNNVFVGCTNLALTSLPANVISIGSYAFYNCTNLALTSLPANVISIESYTFRSCTKLALTSLPEGVTSIGNDAFVSCTNLALTSLPEGVTSIGDYAFYRCTGPTNLIFLGTPTSIASNAFTLSGANLFVPWSSGAVANAPWGAASVTYDYTPVAKYWVTVTDGQTHTINSLGVSAATVVSWGDGLSNEYTGTATRTHVYANAGTYEVKIYTPENVTTFDLRDGAAVSVINSADLKLMVNVDIIYLNNLPNATGTFNSADLVYWRPSTFYLHTLTKATCTLNSSDMVDWRPSSFILYNFPNATITLNSADLVDWRPSSFQLYNLTNATGTFNSADLVDWRPSNFYIYNLPNATVMFDSSDMVDWRPDYFTLYSIPSATITLNSSDMVNWRPSTFRLIALPNATVTIATSSIKNWATLSELQLRTGNLTQPQADLVLWECYQIVRTKTGGTINMTIAGNAAPSGTFQAATSCPVTSATPGKEIAYELLNDSCGKGFNKWATVSTN